MKSNCLVCGEELLYRNDYIEVKCEYCKKTYSTNVTCKNFHYICDKCHSLQGNDFILNYCRFTEEKDPYKIAVEIMKDKSIHMHGPEHHFLVPAILIASYYNNLGKGETLKAEKLEIAKERAKYVKGGFCGFYGSCGAAVGAGIFLSIITETTPLTKKTWGLVNEMTGRVLIELSEIGGPRCCKKGVFTAIKEASKIIEREFGLEILEGNKTIKCGFSKFNKECIGKSCPYNLGA